MKSIFKYFRYSVPLWCVGLFTNWLPEHELVCKFRGWLARPFIGRCGEGFKLGSHVTILCPEMLVVGKFVYVARGSWFNCLGGITVADQVMFGPYVVISTGQYEFKDDSVCSEGGIVKPVTIGRGTWVGSHVSVKCGVNIASGNIIGANACVVKDTPVNAILGGVPAKIIRLNENQPS